LDIVTLGLHALYRNSCYKTAMASIPMPKLLENADLNVPCIDVG